MHYYTNRMFIHRSIVLALIAVVCLAYLGPAKLARATGQHQHTVVAQPDELLPCGSLIASGQTMSCALSLAAEVDSVTFHNNGNTILLLRVGSTAGDIKPQIRVFSPGAVKICENANPYGNGVEIGSCVLSENGTYTITIADYSGTRVGNYNLYAQQLNNGVVGIPIATGTAATGSLATAATASIYSFSASAGAVVLARLGVSAGTMAPDVRIYAPDGVQICRAFNQYGRGTEASRCVLPQTGSYTLFITDYYAVRNGSYQVYLQQLVAPVGMTDLVLGSVKTGSLPSAALSDSYALPAAANDVIQLRLGVTAGTMHPLLRVFSPEGVLVCGQNNQYGSGVEIPRCVLPQSGTYLVLVADVSATGIGSYSLFTQRLWGAVGAQPLGLGTQTSSTIASAAQVNSYTIDAQANDVLVVRVARSVGSLNPSAVLFDPNGIEICRAASQYGAAIELQRCAIAQDGTYTLFVADVSVVNTGGYGVYVQSLVSPAGSWLLSVLGTFGGILPGVAWANTFSWVASANETLRLRMTDTSGTLRPSIRVYDPDGTLVCSASQQYNLTAEIGTCLLPRNGLYTILATDANGTGTGGYNLSISCLSPSCGGMLSKPIDAAGGVLKLGVLTITIPPSAFAAQTNLALGLWQSATSGVDPGALVLQSFRLQADQNGQPITAASLPLTLTATYPQGSSRIPYLAQWDATTQRWMRIEGQQADGVETITATSTAISNIALIMPPATQHRVYVAIVQR